jgi:hypothetical protein
MLETIVLTAAITLLVAFPLGILTSKWVLMEGESIKAHVSNEIEQLRREVSALVAGAAKKI